MGQTQVGPDEGLEADGVEGGAELAKGTLHQSEMHRAHHIGAVAREGAERATAEANGPLRRGHGLGGETGIVEQCDEPLQRLVWIACRLATSRERSPPTVTGCCGGLSRAWHERKFVGEDTRQFAIGHRVLLGDRKGPVTEAGTTPARRRSGLTRDEAGGHQLGELFANAVGMEADPLGEIADAQRTLRVAENPEKPGAGDAPQNAMVVMSWVHRLHFARKCP